MDGRVFISARVGILFFAKYYDESTFPYLYLDLACKQLCFPPGKGINRRNESEVIIIKIVTFSVLYLCKILRLLQFVIL